MIGVVSFSAPGMAVGGVNTIAIKIVEQDELLSQCVMIRRNKLWINAQAWIAVRLRHVAKQLVVGFVFFKNIEHMLEHGWLADAGRNRHGALARPKDKLGLFYLRHTAIFKRLGGIFAERFAAGDGYAIRCSEWRVNLPGCVRRLAIATSKSLYIHHIDVIAVGRHCAWIPIGG